MSLALIFVFSPNLWKVESVMFTSGNQPIPSGSLNIVRPNFFSINIFSESEIAEDLLLCVVMLQSWSDR